MKEMMALQIQLKERLYTICRDIGPRPAGSQENRKVTQYVGNILETSTFAVEYQEFECIDWIKGTASLSAGRTTFHLAPSEYSLPCTITAECRTISSLDELLKADLQGKIACLYGEIVREPLMPKNFSFYNPESHQKIVAALEEKRPSAIITYSFQERTPVPVIEDGDFMIPCAMITKPEPGLPQSLESKVLTLCITSRRRMSSSANIIARYPRDVPSRIIFTAHLDTKPGTPGALDNASGIICLLALSEMINKHNISAGIECVFFNGEDYYSAPGETEYLKKYSDSHTNIKLAVNCDGLSYKNYSNTYACFNLSRPLKHRIDQAASLYSGIKEAPPWYMGDHMLFVMQNIPALACTSSMAHELVNTVIHTPQDTPDKINIHSLASFSRCLYDITEKELS